MKTITKISLAVEIDGKPRLVALPFDKLLLLVKLATSLSETGALPVVKAPEGYKFENLEK